MPHTLRTSSGISKSRAGTPLMATSKKEFDVMAHLEGEWPSQQSILILILYYFTISLILLPDIISAGLSPESLYFGASCLGRGVARHSESLHLIHNTAFANGKLQQ